MKKLIIASLIAAASVFSAEAARVTSYHETISYTAETDYGEIAIQFKKCMANNLFTFYNVKINDKVVNSSQYSDNIGPFATSGGWMGGNHMSNSNKQTARTLSYTATVDGKPAAIGRVNYVLRAIAIPAGEHSVELTFRPKSVTATVSVARAAVIAIYFLLFMALICSLATLPPADNPSPEE